MLFKFTLLLKLVIVLLDQVHFILNCLISLLGKIHYLMQLAFIFQILIISLEFKWLILLLLWFYFNKWLGLLVYHLRLYHYALVFHLYLTEIIWLHSKGFDARVFMLLNPSSLNLENIFTSKIQAWLVFLMYGTYVSFLQYFHWILLLCQNTLDFIFVFLLQLFHKLRIYFSFHILLSDLSLWLLSSFC